MGDHWKSQMTELHEKVVALEKHFEAKPSTSLETAEMVQNAPQYIVDVGVSTQTPLLFQMAMTIMLCADDIGFITSDTPCSWFNPTWYKRPPLFRSPGLGQRDIEVTLPLTPHHLLFISHNHKLPSYLEVEQRIVDEINRRTRFHCAKEFVSWKGSMRELWFDPGVEPNDSWEKSPEGRAAIAERDKLRAIEAEVTQEDIGNKGALDEEKG
jgi:hypothetical protein